MGGRSSSRRSRLELKQELKRSTAALNRGRERALQDYQSEKER